MTTSAPSVGRPSAAPVLPAHASHGAPGAGAPATIRIALAGCGAVGGELIRLLHDREGAIAARFGLRFEVVRVLVRGTSRTRPSELPAGLLTTDLESFLAAEADVVVEAIGGLDPARRIALAALESGRRLVTANKTLVAAHGPELVELAGRSDARIDFESAVAGGIPVIRAIRDQLPLTGISAIRGILNGTSNEILTRLEEGDRYADALAGAQAAGYAEADPSRDVGGADAADKIRILAWLVFGADPAQLPVRIRGITPDPDRLAEAARLLGGVPRLVSECRRDARGIFATVEPVIVRADSELGQVRGADNIVVIESRWNGTLRLSGPGAGGGPTATALLADLVRAAHPVRPPGDGATPAGVPEGGGHRWVVGTRGGSGSGGGAMRAAFARADVSAVALSDDGDTAWFQVETAPWSRIHPVLHSLRDTGLAPVAFRDGR